jgi:hypothetical protein
MHRNGTAVYMEFCHILLQNTVDEKTYLNCMLLVAHKGILKNCPLHSEHCSSKPSEKWPEHLEVMNKC